MSEVSDKLSSNIFSDGELDILNEQLDSLLRQLDYLTGLYEFGEQYDRLSIEPDSLHRLLFERTNFTARSFKNRMTRASKRFEGLKQMLRGKELLVAIRRDVESERWDSSSEFTFTVIESKEFSNSRAKVEEVINSSEEVFNVSITSAVDRLQSVGFEDFSKVAKILDSAGSMYEDRLVEEGFVLEREGGTPSLLTILCLCIIIVCGGVKILSGILGHSLSDPANHFLEGMSMISMGILAVAAL